MSGKSSDLPSKHQAEEGGAWGRVKAGQDLKGR